MNLDEFKQRIKVVSNDEIQDLRNNYIKSFINTSKMYYKNNIEILNKYSDGFCYTGYLWDCLNDVKVVDMEYIKMKPNEIKNVLVMWDIHTEERIFIEDYWKFGKDSILELNFDTLINNLEFLPEDIYIFDISFDWTLIITHEYIDDKRWCLKSGELTASQFAFWCLPLNI